MAEAAAENINSSFAVSLDIPEDVASVRSFCYQVLLPILLGLGVISNGLCTFIAFRPRMTSLYVNAYVKVLAVSDLLGCFLFLPWVLLSQHCVFSDYASAFYTTYFTTTIVSITRSLTFYTIIWLSYDRYLAVWSFEKFKNIRKSDVIRNRIILTILVCIAAFLPVIVSAQVVCIDDLCDPYNGKWRTVNGYAANIHKKWFRIFIGIREIVFRTIPGILLVVLSVGLVLGLHKKSFTTNSETTISNSAFIHTLAVLAINTSFVLCQLPVTIIGIAFYRPLKDQCYSSPKIEALNAFGILVRVLWHTINVFFIFALNREYKKELRTVFSLVPILSSCFPCGASEKNTEEPAIIRDTSLKTAATSL